MNRVQRVLRAMRGLPVPPSDKRIRQAATRQQAGHAQKIARLGAWGDERPRWTMYGLADYITDGFENNSLLYAAIMYKARAIASAPLRAYVGPRSNPEPAPDDHPLAQLVRRPNEYQSRFEFNELLIVLLNLAGSVYLWLDRDDPLETPRNLWLLRPDRVKIVPMKDEHGIQGYLYVPRWSSSADDVIPLLPEDVMHIKMPNPGDSLMGLGGGLSPLAPGAKSTDVDNQITAFLKTFFEKGAQPPGVLKFDVPMEDDDVDKARARWMEVYGGAENWTDVAVLDQGGSYQQIGSTFKDMAFDGLDARNETRVLGPLGVPAILIGARVGLERSTFSNFEEARKMFWEDTMDPELKLLEEDYAHYLTTPDGGFVMYDRSQVPALRKNIKELTAAAKDLIDAGVPPLQAFEAVGLSVSDYPSNDVSIFDRQRPRQQPVIIDGKAAQKALPVPFVPDNLNRKAGYTPAEMAVKMDQLAVDWEERFGDTARAQFERDKREMLVISNEYLEKALQRKQAFDWQALTDDLLDYVRGRSEDEWRDEFLPLIEGLMLEAGEEWAVALGAQFNIRNLRGEAWFDDYMLVFAQPINETTSDSIHALLAQAEAEGWTIAEMQGRLETLFQQWMDGDLTAEDFVWFEERMPPHRRELIARTETMRAGNAGAFEIGQEYGAAYKGWEDTADDRTRDSHIQAGKDYQEGGTPGLIRIDEPFVVGGHEMMYPLDSSRGAPMEEIANCRCTSLMYTKDEVEGDDKGRARSE